MTKVLVVEDQRIHREYMENLILHSGHYEILPSVTAADVALRLCRSATVDLILMNTGVDGTMDGIRATEEIKKIRPDIKIVVVTSMLDAECMEKAKIAGADSMWYKDATDEALMDVISQTMEGKHVFPESAPSVKVGLVSSDEFTKTESDILRGLVNGLSSKQISEKLNISTRTIDWHINNLLEKTGLSNRMTMAIRVAQCKLFVIKEEDLDTM